MTEIPVELVVFDLGGVLVRIVRSWTEAHARAGFPPHPITESPEFGARRAELELVFGVGALTSDAYFAAVAEASRGVYTPADVRRILELLRYVDAARAHGWRAELIDPLADPPAQLLGLLRRDGVG